MSVGFLLLLNISTIPFLFELEQIRAAATRPSVAAILRLKAFRSTRWAWGFAVLWLLFLALALAPTSSGKSYPASWGHIFGVALIQFALWGLAIWRTNQPESAREKDAG